MTPVEDPAVPTRAELEDHLRRFLEARRVLTLASVGEDGAPWTCTVAFAFDDAFRLVLVSAATTRHVKEIARDPRVAVALHEPQEGRYDLMRVRGVQLEGTARILEGDELLEGLATYGHRFFGGLDVAPETVVEKRNGRVVRITPERILFLDRGDLGDRFEWRPERDGVAPPVRRVPTREPLDDA